MSDPFATLSPDESGLLRRGSMPDWIQPMKAVLTAERFSRDDWIFEPKLDGVRCLAFCRDDDVRLFSRNHNRLDASYPEIAGALSEQSVRGVFDGEIVAFADGAPSFARLQRRMHVADPDRARRTGVPVFYYVFDVLHVAGCDTRPLPLDARKKVLRKSLRFGAPLKLVSHRRREGEAYFREICAKPGWEGVIAKRASSRYVETRSRDWLKFKCANEQEMVVGGYTDPQGSRSGFGALLVGYYDGDELRYAGKVGTGFDHELLDRLSGLLKRRTRKSSPFVDLTRAPKGVHWVRPDLVAQVGFSEWTGDGRLRHPRFLGLRNDKNAREVVREVPS